MTMHFGTLPIPAAALDDRLAFVGTSGSGKTYAAGTAIERLLHERKRAGIVDPLGVWWGLRLLADGKTPSGFPVVIFGGPHGDIPITPSAGALVGETAAGMKESFIIDLSELGSKSAERKFMLGFLEALYRHASGEPFHLVVDEADLFAPQKTSEPMLQSLMEQIVRRGRVKGFIPWLITQRPAVISKDVLSQADGLIAMKLTASQDRDALGGWIEGQADKAEEKKFLNTLPTLESGNGVIWVPARGVFERCAFPPKVTFDSSRTPKRGEKRVTRDLKPLDVEKLRGRLAKVEQEAADKDPVKLKRRIAELEATIRKPTSNVVEKIIVQADPAIVERAMELAYVEGFMASTKANSSFARQKLDELSGVLKAFASGDPSLSPVLPMDVKSRLLPKLLKSTPKAETRVAASVVPVAKAVADNLQVSRAVAAVASGFTGPQTKILRALAMWKGLGHPSPTREMVAAVVGYSSTSGGFKNPIYSLNTMGAVRYPEPGTLELVAEVDPIAPAEARAMLEAAMSGPQKRIIEALSHGPMERTALADLLGYSPTSGGFKNPIYALHTLTIVTYPSAGSVELAEWVFDLMTF